MSDAKERAKLRRRAVYYCSKCKELYIYNKLIVTKYKKFDIKVCKSCGGLLLYLSPEAITSNSKIIKYIPKPDLKILPMSFEDNINSNSKI